MPLTATDLNVLIVADDFLARTGLAALLADEPTCTIAGQVSGETDLFAALHIYHPDVVLWRLGWDPRPSLKRLAEWSENDPPVLALLPDETCAADAWTTGARGLLLCEVTGQDLLAALWAVARGFLVLDPTLVEILEMSKSATPVVLIEELTPRESEVLQLLAQGLANKAIAYRLGISEHTVKFHVNAIMGKLDARSRTEAAVRATRMGLIFF